jgi:hypothetical protein
MILGQIKVWLMALGGALFAVLGVVSVYYKGKAKRMEIERDSLKATIHAVRVRKKIKKEEDIRLSKRVKEIKEKVNKNEEIDSLSNPNDNW